MKFEVCGRRILVNPKQDPEKIGDIHLPDQAKQRPSTGVVVKVGSEVSQIEPGMTLLFSKWVPISIVLESKTYLIVEEPDVLGFWPIGAEADARVSK